MKRISPFTILSLFLLHLAVAVSPCFGKDDREIEIILKRSQIAFDLIKDYRCIVHKKELVKGKMSEDRNITFKFRKPASFYFKYNEGGWKGCELIYVAGKHDNKLRVHLGGMMGFISMAIDPVGALAMRDSRHPIMEAGVGQVLSIMNKTYLRAKTDPDSSITLEKGVLTLNRKSFLIKAVLPKREGYYGHVLTVAIDQELFLPIKVTVFGWDAELLEEYEYDGMKVNVGLTDMDFDTSNPEYHF